MLQCGPDVQKLKFKFRRGSLVAFYPDDYTGCIAGCDPHFLECLDIRWNAMRPGGRKIIILIVLLLLMNIMYSD